MRKLSLAISLIAALALQACASGNPATCTGVTFRDAGMGTTVASCSEWQFGGWKSGPVYRPH